MSAPEQHQLPEVIVDKQKVRDWMKKREVERKRLPPPTPDEIRRQLGPVPTTKKR